MDCKTRVSNAFRAMKALGIPADKVKPVFKDVVTVYEQNWSIIEADNYRVLIDAISESEAVEPCLKVVYQSEDGVKKEETEALGRPLKRVRVKHSGQSSQTGSTSKTQTRHKLNGPLATVQSLGPNTRNTMAESMAVTNPSLRKIKIEQKSSTTALIENNGKAMTEDVQLLEAPLEIFCPDFSKTIASLNAKYGPIDKDCNLSSNLMKKLTLAGICRTLKQLGKRKLDELDISSLSPYYDLCWMDSYSFWY